ncbi:hypothetical protein BDW22DRAFT_310243 [Trametopsis cervina]|nr:hypothetical protein BDW22DRAFT_310243 [Trametopsis cervina]
MAYRNSLPPQSFSVVPPVVRDLRNPYQRNVPTPSNHGSQSRAAHLKTPVLDIPSVYRSTTPAHLHIDSPDSPVSPLVFRKVEDFESIEYRHLYGRTLRATSSWSDISARYSSHEDIPSTKRSIASLDISDSHPCPSYDILSTAVRRAQDSLRAASPHRLPIRTSSLRNFQQTGSAPMSRSVSPSPSQYSITDDQCSEQMVFAARDMDEPEYGCGPDYAPATLHPSPRSLWSSWKLSSGPSSSSDTPKRSKRSPSPSLPPTNIRVPQNDLLAFYPSSLVTGSPVFCGSPTPTHTKKPKPLSSSHSSSSIDSSEASSDKSSRFASLNKRVRTLVSRKSISSLEAMGGIGGRLHESHTTSTIYSTDSIPLSRITSRTHDGIEPPQIIISSGDSQLNVEHSIDAHLVIDGQWKRQDVREVIPALRSLRFGGKH